MSRAYIVYILTFVVLAGGLLLIFTLGEAVRAPDDVSGDWTVNWDASPPEGGDETMKVSQSGRFFIIQFGKRRPMSMTLQRDWRSTADGARLNMHLTQSPWMLNIWQENRGKDRWRIPQVKIELIGPSHHIGTASRVVTSAAGVPANHPPETAHAR